MNLAQTDFVANPQATLLDKSDANLAASLRATPPLSRIATIPRLSRSWTGFRFNRCFSPHIVRIRYASPSPEWAQRISVGVAEQFEKMTLDMRFSASNYARHFLEERLQELKVKLEASEKQLIEYAQKEGIVDVDNKQPQVMTELQGVQNAYSQAVTSRLLLAEAWNQAQADGGNSLPQVMGDGIIQGARAKLSQLRANYQDRLTVVKPDFPEMIALRSQISETEKDIRNTNQLDQEFDQVPI